MSFQQGLSGLNAASKSLETIGNNVANSNTVGFKGSQAQFADVFASSLNGGSGAQIGIGTQLVQVAQEFTQGNITSSTNPLDIAINGNGFFRLDSNGASSYTRNGQFQANASGQLTDQQGNLVPGPRNQPVRVNADGTVTPANVGLFSVPNAAKVGDTYFTGNATGNAPGEIRSGALESSGLDAARSVVQMLASLRAIEAGQKALTTIDESLGKANQVGSLR